MNEIDNAIKLVLLNKKKTAYDQKYFDLTIDFEIATEVNDLKLRQSVIDEMAKFKKAIKFIEDKIKALEKEVKDFVSES